MKKKNLILKNNIQEKNLKTVSKKKLEGKFEKIFLDIKHNIKNKKNCLNILDKGFKYNFKTQDLKKFKKFKTIAFIGMGGSILGSEAIYDFFKNKIKKKIYFFDNLDENKISYFKKKETISKVLFVVTSKSGNTIETLSNIFLLKVIKKRANNLILIAEKNNLLHLISKKFNIFFVEHKNFIGGRYSVLSEVGLIPSYLMGINIKRFRSNISNCLKGNNKVFLKDSSIKLAELINTGKFNNLIFLNYEPSIQKFLYWCQQLIAESLGKKGKGFLPMISNVPKDHHSLLQLYLDGPKDKIFNIFSLEKKSKEVISISNSININHFLNKKKFNNIKIAQKNALIKTFIKKNIYFREFEIKRSSEEVLGELFAYFILETVIVGKMININPFDQPAVEQVKIYTKNYLVKKSK